MRSQTLIIYVVIFALCALSDLQARVPLGKCVNPAGKKVDWYFLYFMNSKYNSFVYADNVDQKFRVYPTTIETFPPLEIVRHMNLQSSSWAVWNDRTIKETEENFSTQAHSKGMLSFDDKEGVYLMHSLPGFPLIKKDSNKFLEDFPDNAGVYAQTFACVTLSHESLGTMLSNLIVMHPGIQASFFHKKLTKLKITESFYKFVELPRTKKEPAVLPLFTVGGTELSFFIKPNVEAISLPWDGVVPEVLQSDIIVGTWTKPKILDTLCNNKYKTLNALSYNILGMEYDNNQDHSKWGVTVKPKAICIGDLNRTESQLSRSGSVMCIYNNELSKQSKKFIVSTSKCPSSLKFLWIDLDN